MRHKLSSPITQAYLQHILHYDPLTGDWTWINPNPRARNIRRGDIAGTVRSDGRRQINLSGKCYLAARLAWLYMTGVWPEDEIDHENRIKGDDRWDNLRPATHSQNMYNREWCERSGNLRGICKDGNQFRVIIGNSYLGYYKTLEEAISARDEALKVWAGPFAVIPERKVS
jgi:HNH endonuclease